MLKELLVVDLKRLMVLTLIFALLIVPGFNKGLAQSNSSHLDGKIVVGILFDEKVTQEMKDQMLKEDKTIIKTNEGEMVKIPSDFNIELHSKNGKYVYKTTANQDGTYSFSDVKTSKYYVTVSFEDRLLSTKEVIINKGRASDAIIGLTVDEFLDATMHAEDEAEEHDHTGQEVNTEEHTHSEEENQAITDLPVMEEEQSQINANTDEQGISVGYSHKFPHMQCLDFNGPNAPDRRHVHDWAHFYRSDCFLAAYYKCSTDHNNSTEYCDGTKNCSGRIGHSNVYHAH